MRSCQFSVDTFLIEYGYLSLFEAFTLRRIPARSARGVIQLLPTLESFLTTRHSETEAERDGAELLASARERGGDEEEVEKHSDTLSKRLSEIGNVLRMSVDE